MVYPVHTHMASEPDQLLVAGLVFEPYIIKEKDGTVRGIVVDIVREVGRRTGLKIEFSITNWPRAFRSVKQGDADALIPAMKSKDREVFLYYPNQPLLRQEMFLVKQKGKEINFDGSMDSLKNYRIANVNKVRISPEFDQAVEDGVINVEYRNNPDLTIIAVAKGRVDLTATSRYLATWTAQKLNLDDKIEFVKPKLASVATYLALSKSKVSIKQAKLIDEVLKDIHKDGTFQQILQSYLGQDIELQ